MAMSNGFQQRLHPKLTEIAAEYGTPFHVYDEQGIRESCRRFGLLSDSMSFRQYFAVKAQPNPHILEILFEEGMGFDCASVPEIELARMVGADGEDIFFTSNNTQPDEFRAALDVEAIVNLDDTCFLDTLRPFPGLACFRMAAGDLDRNCVFMGAAEDSKFGVPYLRLEDAYRRAIQLGSTRFGFHAMLCSNQTSAERVLDLADVIMQHASRLAASLGIGLEFVNIGGGIGIPHKPDDADFDFPAFVEGLPKLRSRYFGDETSVFTECGRYVTGPHGVLVTSVVNVMHKFRTHIGVDAGMSALMRPAMYPNAYHHITLPFVDGEQIVVDVGGSLCENNDKFAIQRSLPEPKPGDLMIVHDTGAHGASMGFTYNGRLRPKEILLKADGTVSLIRNAETFSDYISTIARIEDFYRRPAAEISRAS